MSETNRIARGFWTLSALGFLVGVYACAAPDAVPGKEMPPPDAGPDMGMNMDAEPPPDTGMDVNMPPPVEPLAGVPQWAHGFGGPADQRAFDLATSPNLGGVAATIGFYKEIVIPGGLSFSLPSTFPGVVVGKFGIADGVAEWAHHLESTDAVSRSTVAVDNEGNVIVGGGYNGTMTIGKDDQNNPITVTNVANYDAFIAKYDKTGKPLWVRSFGEGYFEIVSDVATDKQGNIIVVGVTEGALYEFGKTSAMMPVSPTPYSNDPGRDDLFVAKFDSMGNAIWAKRFGTAGNRTDGPGISTPDEPVITVAVSQKDDSILVGGSFSLEMRLVADADLAVGKDDGFVAKFDADGNRQWHVTFGDDNSVQRVRSVALTSQGEAYFTGSFQGLIGIGDAKATSYKATEDLLVGKLDTDGKPIWISGYGLLGKQVGTNILVDAKDQPIVLGSFTGGIDFSKVGGAILDTNVDVADKTDIFITKFSSSGTHFWARAYGDATPGSVDNQDMGGAVLATSGNLDFAIVAGMNRGSMEVKPLNPLVTAAIEDGFLMAVTY